MAKLERPLADYFRQNFWVAGSGTVSERYLRRTAEVVGTDRMLYSTDYPYTFGTRPGGFPFLDTSGGVARGRSSRVRRSPRPRRLPSAPATGNG